MSTRIAGLTGFGIVVCLACGLLDSAAAGDDAPKVTPAHPLTGQWQVHYVPNHAMRVYEIRPDGCVSFGELPGCTGRLELLDSAEGQWRLHFDGDPATRCERLTMCADQRLLVEHFHPASQWKDGLLPDQIGLGKRVVPRAGESPQR